MIEKFAGYGFNKSHSTAYALIAYMTAYLKAHYSGRVHGRAAVGRHPGPQFQEEGLARRAHRRLPADEHRRRAARREPLRRRLHRRRRQDPVRAGRHQGLRRAGGRGDRRANARARGPFRDLFDFCERVDPAGVNRDGDRIADQGRRLRLLRRHALAMDERASNGRCNRAPRPWPIAVAAKRDCSTTSTKSRPPPPRPACPTCPSGTNANGWSHEKEVLGFYLSSHPLAEHRRDAGSLLHAHHGRGRGPAAPHRGGAGRHARLDQVLAHQESPARQHRHQVRHVRPGRHGGHDALHRLARGVRQLRRTGQGRRACWPCAA